MNRKHFNFRLVILLLIVISLSAIANLCLNKYYGYILPDKLDMIYEKIEPSWDRTAADIILKLFIPKWQEEILDQERIIRLHADAPAKIIEARLKMSEIYEKRQKYDAYGLNADIWDPKWEAAAAIGKDYWNVEIAIPFKELNTSAPQKGDIWGFNLTRARRAGETEISNWSFTEGSHHRPEKFGYLVFN